MLAFSIVTMDLSCAVKDPTAPDIAGSQTHRKYSFAFEILDTTPSRASCCEIYLACPYLRVISYRQSQITHTLLYLTNYFLALSRTIAGTRGKVHSSFPGSAFPSWAGNQEEPEETQVVRVPLSRLPIALTNLSKSETLFTLVLWNAPMHSWTGTASEAVDFVVCLVCFKLIRISESALLKSTIRSMRKPIYLKELCTNPNVDTMKALFLIGMMSFICVDMSSFTIVACAPSVKSCCRLSTLCYITAIC